MTASAPIGSSSLMSEVLAAYPGAQRALFRGFHIGGCSSCGFQPTETLEDVCRRNQNLDVTEVLRHITQSHDADQKLLVSPETLHGWLHDGSVAVRVLDIRSREEFEAVAITGSVFLSQNVMQELMGKWGRDDRVVIVDHSGKSALDAAAYFQGHGFTQVFGLRGGIDAWAQEVDKTMPRYRVE